MLEIGWFSTGKGETSMALLKAVYKAVRDGKIPDSRISFVFCNRKYGESAGTDKFLDLAKLYNLPVVSWSSKNFKPELKRQNPEKWREEYDKIIISFLTSYRTDICLMAGYMLIASPLLCRSYKIINLHPSKPGGPKGTWQEVINQLIDGRTKETGCMLHLITPELDAGPPITFCAFPIRVAYETDDMWRYYDLFHEDWMRKKIFNWIRAEGVKREPILIVETLKLLALGRIKTQNKKRRGRNLTKSINSMISVIACAWINHRHAP